VIQLIANGKPDKEIAGCLSIGNGSVESHVAHTLSKLAARDRAHAIAIASNRGIIEL
jgi:DNA-binding NarL/FixJ family response regulator